MKYRHRNGLYAEQRGSDTYYLYPAEIEHPDNPFEVTLDMLLDMGFVPEKHTKHTMKYADGILNDIHRLVSAAIEFYPRNPNKTATLIVDVLKEYGVLFCKKK